MSNTTLGRIDSLLSNLKVDKILESKECINNERDIKNDKLLMIPGPVEFDSDVLNILSKQTMSHVDPRFIKIFSETLKDFRKILKGNESCQPFILSGGGSLGWDCIVSSLCSKGDKALVLNTGYFSDNFRMCLEAYDVEIDEILYPVGGIADVKTLKDKLLNNNYKLLAITDVDTSTAVKNPCKELALLCNKLSPSTLIAVDGVCSFGGNRFMFSDWKIDAAMTCSQKCFGVPPGLMMLLLSEKAMNVLNSRKVKINSWYCNLQRWLPIMKTYENCGVSYFSTPNVNLIMSLNISCKQLLNEGMENVWKRHLIASNAFKKALLSINLEFVPLNSLGYSPTITAVKYPKSIDGNKFRSYCKEFGCIFAGGLHKKIKTTYFRVGHMGISTMYNKTDDVLNCVKAIEYGLNKCGYKFERGKAIKTYQNVLRTSNL